MTGERSRRAILWARVSTDRSELDNQRRVLRDYAEAHSLDVIDERVLVMSATRSKTYPRELRELVRDARRDRYDVLVSVSLDRLSRSVRQTLQLLGDLWDAGIDVIPIRDEWIHGIPEAAREFAIAGIAFGAQIETAVLSERTKAGIARARAEGKRIGRPSTLAAVDIPRVLTARERGDSWRRIAAEHPPTIERANGKRVRPSESTIRDAVKAHGQSADYQKPLESTEGQR